MEEFDPQIIKQQEAEFYRWFYDKNSKSKWNFNKSQKRQTKLKQDADKIDSLKEREDMA